MCYQSVLDLGAQTRLHAPADVPVQKILGMFSEVWNVCTLTYALCTFYFQCKVNLQNAFNISDISTDFWAGPGLYCYSLCVISGMIMLEQKLHIVLFKFILLSIGGVRAMVHWLTPMPGRGHPDLSVCTRLCHCWRHKHELLFGKMLLIFCSVNFIMVICTGSDAERRPITPTNADNYHESNENLENIKFTLGTFV